MEQKQNGGEIVIQSRRLKWLDNFWYHYKWHTIVVLFFLFVGVVCFTQCSGSTRAKFKVTYCGGYTLSQAEVQNINAVLEVVSPRDREGKPSSIMLNTYSVYTEDELRKTYVNEDGELVAGAFYNALQVSKDNLKTFSTYTMTGDSAVWLVSEAVFETLYPDKSLVSLAELFGATPENAANDYAIYLRDTAIYQYYDALKVLPADTMIVMPRQLLLGASANDATYAEFRALYQSILNFKAPN